MKIRTISAIFLLIILIGSLVFDSRIFGLVMVVAAIIGFNEAFNIKFGRVKELLIIKIIGIVCLILLTLNTTFYNFNVNTVVLLPLLALTIPIVFYNNNKLYGINDALYVLGMVYILGFAFGNVIHLRDTNIYRCIFIFVVAFITDTYAYIGGILIGKHKLTKMSPKKTIEGTIIGSIMGIFIGSMYYYNIVGGITLSQTIVLCLVLTILSEIGDLLFSSIKRNFDKKDYSNIIPGHGGLLDRFDSVIYVSLGLALLMSIF